MYDICFSHFTVPQAVECFKHAKAAGIENLCVQFILLSYDEDALEKFQDVCRELPRSTRINLHPNSFPFNSLNLAEREEEIRQYFVGFILLWIPKFIEAALSHGLVVRNVVLHAGFQVIDCDISGKENVLRRGQSLEKVVSSYTDICQRLEEYDCTLTLENGVRAETSRGRLLCPAPSSVQALEIPYTFDEIEYLTRNLVDLTFDLFKYFETLPFPDLDERVDLTLKHLQRLMMSGRVRDIQMSPVKQRPERFTRDLAGEVKNLLQDADFKGTLTLEGYWNLSVESLTDDLRLFSS